MQSSVVETPGDSEYGSRRGDFQRIGLVVVIRQKVIQTSKNYQIYYSYSRGAADRDPPRLHDQASLPPGRDKAEFAVIAYLGPESVTEVFPEKHALPRQHGGMALRWKIGRVLIRSEQPLTAGGKA